MREYEQRTRTLDASDFHFLPVTDRVLAET
jgi:hypothetical protein